MKYVVYGLYLTGVVSLCGAWGGRYERLLQAIAIPVTWAMVQLRRDGISPALFEPMLTAPSFLQLADLALAVVRRPFGPPHGFPTRQGAPT